MNPQPALLHPIVSMLLVALLGALATYCVQTLLRRVDRESAKEKELETKVAMLEKRLERLEDKMGFLWKGIEEHLTEYLKR